jgi:hypothetical protein
MVWSGMVTRLRASRSGVRIPVRTSDFSLLQYFQTGFGLTQWVLSPFSGIKRFGREVNHSLSSSAEVNKLSYTSTPICLRSMYRHKSTFTFIGQVPLQVHIIVNNDIRCYHWGKNAAGLWRPAWKLNRQSTLSRKESWQHSKYMCQQVLSVMSIRESRLWPWLNDEEFLFLYFLFVIITNKCTLIS